MDFKIIVNKKKNKLVTLGDGMFFDLGYDGSNNTFILGIDNTTFQVYLTKEEAENVFGDLVWFLSEPGQTIFYL